MCYALLRTVVVSFVTFRYLNTASFTITSKECFCRRINEVNTINIHEIVVETNNQWIGNSHPTTFTIALHFIFLATYIKYYLICFWSMEIEIGTTFFVNFREFVAWYCCLCDESISRNFYTFRHLDIWTLWGVAEKTCYCFAIAAAQFAIAGCIKMQTVRTITTTIRRDNLASMDSLRQFVNLFFAANANTLAVSLYDVTSKQWYILWFQFQIA